MRLCDCEIELGGKEVMIFLYEAQNSMFTQIDC